MPEAALSFSHDAPIVRAPRLRAVVNETVIVGPSSAHVTHHSSCIAATFSLLIPLTGASGPNIQQWLSFNKIHVKIQIATTPAGQFTDLIEGYCDTIQVHPTSRYLRLDGRDRSASLLDSKTSADFQNQTASEIVTSLADRHGLTPVTASISDFVGRRYASNTNIVTLTQFAKLTSDWDILVALAQAHGYDLFVVGTSLYFQPSATTSGPAQDIPYPSLLGIRMSRSLSLSNGVQVTVASWNSAIGSAIAESADTKPSNSSDNLTQAPTRKYTMMQPNLSSANAKALATQVAETISGEAMSIQFEMPGEISLDPRRPIRLSGSGTNFDTIYKIATIVRSYRSHSGFSQAVRAKSLVGSF